MGCDRDSESAVKERVGHGVRVGCERYRECGERERVGHGVREWGKSGTRERERGERE